MGIHIRYATIADADGLGQVYSQSYQTAFRGIIPDSFMEERFTPEKRSERLKSEMVEGVLTNMTVHKDDELIGILTYGIPEGVNLEESAVELGRMFLLPSYWGQNIGAEVLNLIIPMFKEKGFNRIDLWVIEDNVRARRLYERMGFTHDGVIRIINVGKELKDLKYTKQI